MKVRVVGSGNMASIYNSASYIIDEEILIDAPNGSWKQVKNFGIEPRNINYICFTHFHGDHYFDIPFYLIAKLKADNKHINLYLDRKNVKNIKKLFSLAFPNSVDKVKNNVNTNYVFSKSFKINDYNILRILVDHGELKPAYGYIFDNGKIKVGFTGDTNLCKNVWKMASVCDYLICDCSMIEGTNKHMGVDNIFDINKKYTNLIIVLSHLDDSVREYLKNKKLNNVIVPKDGEVIIDTK